MRSLLVLLLVTLTGSPALPAAPARVIHLGLSPFLGTAQRGALIDELPAWLLDKAATPAGTRLVFWDAWNLQTIVDFTIPTLEIDTPRSRTPRLLPHLAALGHWLHNPPPPPDGVPANSGALRAPEWLFQASAPAATGPRVCILVGSPLYRSPQEPSFDMSEDARYPSDGQLSLRLRESVFGLAEKAGRLDGTTVLWCYFGESIWANALHRHAVTRFWALFVQGQGGVLSAFGPDLPAMLAGATQSQHQPVLRAQPDPADEKPLMHSARPRMFPTWLEIPAPPPAAPTPAAALPESPAVPAPVVSPPETPAVPPAPAKAPVPVVEAKAVPFKPPPGFDPTKTGIGIAWATDDDIDLHVQLRPDVTEISYLRDATSEGILYKDERRANAGRYFEFVEFRGTGPVDLSQTKIWVHYYSGRSKNITGQVVLFDRGKIKVGTFSLNIPRGIGWHFTRGRASNPSWVEIHLADLVETGVPLMARKPTQN